MVLAAPTILTKFHRLHGTFNMSSCKILVPFFLPMETKSGKRKKIACHISITATHAHATKGLWAGKAMGKGQRGHGRGKGEGAQ